ncbi:MAG: choice-of-anchor P family protein, partial [Pyrinomonadaceae bacterium]
MKKEENRLFGFLITVAVVGLFGLATAQAQTTNTFSGQATGIDANVSVLGAVSVNTTVAQTDALPPSGGAGGGFTKQVLSGTVSFGALGGTNNLSTGVINTMTSGGNPAGTPNSSQSQASVAFLNALLLTNTITADEVRANSVCTCTNGVPNCTGTTTLTNLRINGTLITSNATASVILPGGVGTVFINEQTVTGTGQTRAITVNALRISINVPGTLVADIIISQAKSDITCAPAGTGCTPTTTVTEGDLQPGGISSFGVTSGPNSVTVDHVNAGSGLQSFTVVSSSNAVVNIPAF